MENTPQRFEVRIDRTVTGEPGTHQAAFYPFPEEGEHVLRAPRFKVYYDTVVGEQGHLRIHRVSAEGTSELSPTLVTDGIGSLARYYFCREVRSVEVDATALQSWNLAIEESDSSDYEFYYREAWRVSLNLVPFQDHWHDDMGGMASAIYDLVEMGREVEARLQGDFIDHSGRRTAWNYCPKNQVLFYHIAGEGTWRVTPESAEVTTDRGEEFKRIYRPFLRDCQSGKPKLEWLKTREVMVVKNHHIHRTPVSLARLVKNLPHLFKNLRLNRYDRNFPVRWENLICHIRPDKDAVTPPSVAAAHASLCDAAKSEESDQYIYRCLRDLNHALFAISGKSDFTLNGTGYDLDIDEFASKTLIKLAEETQAAHEAGVEATKKTYLDLLRIEYNCSTQNEGLVLTELHRVNRILTYINAPFQLESP